LRRAHHDQEVGFLEVSIFKFVETLRQVLPEECYGRLDVYVLVIAVGAGGYAALKDLSVHPILAVLRSVLYALGLGEAPVNLHELV